MDKVEQLERLINNPNEDTVPEALEIIKQLAAEGTEIEFDFEPYGYRTIPKPEIKKRLMQYNIAPIYASQASQACNSLEEALEFCKNKGFLS